MDRSDAARLMVQWIARSIDPTANWKVIVLVSADIEAVSGPAAQDRPETRECFAREGEAADKAEALQKAEKSDPRVELAWMCVRCERDVNIQ